MWLTAQIVKWVRNSLIALPFFVIFTSPLSIFAGPRFGCVSLEDLSSGAVKVTESVVLTPCSDDAASQIGLVIGGRYGALAATNRSFYGPPNTDYFRKSRSWLHLADEFEEYIQARQGLDTAFYALLADKNETDPLKTLIWFRYIGTFGKPGIEDKGDVAHLSKLLFEDAIEKIGGTELAGVNVNCVVRHDLPRHNVKDIMKTFAYQQCAGGGE